MTNEATRLLIKELLEEKYEQYNRPEFIEDDPIAVPHQFSQQNDIEIAAFLAATIAWGQRPMIVKKGMEMMQLMDYSPFEFVKFACKDDFARLKKFIYRTFKDTDLVYFIGALQKLINDYGTLGNSFKSFYEEKGNVYDLLVTFHCRFFQYKKPGRTQKHLSNPAKGSAAKRMNMMLRWMVRNDNRGVDFGLWQFIKPSALYLPLDVHTARISRKLGILTRRSNDWRAVEEVSKVLQEFDTEDPAKYDFALFGLGIFEKF
ncbi:MAG TPA: TIGR02757 family protein [Salinivirga sp.]|uniref:TIGR02757 family protein n=1 Tax=Salinivirga sp. TaxID=1970192 RepID=UPI002B4A5702|nr:TIGR02757 family protein [Salinivirga sp.]HKK59079.1 TIGR02757 family protein [Salinivirga sp.]